MDTQVFDWTLFDTKCPKYVQISLKYGHFLDTSSSVGHILDMNWTLFAKRCPKSLVWTLLWTHFGHLEQKCVQKVSVPTSCWSTQEFKMGIGSHEIPISHVYFCSRVDNSPSSKWKLTFWRRVFAPFRY